MTLLQQLRPIVYRYSLERAPRASIPDMPPSDIKVGRPPYKKTRFACKKTADALENKGGTPAYNAGKLTKKGSKYNSF